MAKNNNSGKLNAQNTFEGGLVADLHEMASPSNTVRDSLNMELITAGADQYIYQNIRGDKEIVPIMDTDYIHEGKPYPWIPLGLKVHNDIAYILAGAFGPDQECLAGVIGTFPSPDWDALNDPNVGSSNLLDKFSPLHNFQKEGEESTDSPFVTYLFNFEKNRHIEMEIQGDFDGSVNVIFTDNLNPPGIINSRFKRLENNTKVYLADRERDDSNLYSESDWDRIALIQNANFPIVVEGPEVETGGYLKGGGYRYFFKYTTQEGNTTDLLYESSLIPIANGQLGLSKDQVSDKKVVFEIGGLDPSYSGIKVYFSHSDGLDAAVTDIFEIEGEYLFNSGESILTITHTGLEEVTAIDATEINASFTPLDTVRSSAIINDRLAFAGVTSTLKNSDIQVLTQAALNVTLWENMETLSGTTYADPNTASKKLGYWKGETYEFGIVFLLRNKGLSPVFPVTGMDNFDSLQRDQDGNLEPEFIDGYPDYELGTDGFSDDDYLFNNKGIFRTSNTGDIYTPKCDGVGDRHITYIEADTSGISSTVIDEVDVSAIASGFFIVRRDRVKNVLMQGMISPTLRLPAKYPSLTEEDAIKDSQKGLDCSKRYLSNYSLGTTDNEWGNIGLNSKYSALKKSGIATFNSEFNAVFVPQPTQMINVVTFDKAWLMSGGIGQDKTTTEYGLAVDREGKKLNKMYMSFMSAELDLNGLDITESLNGINPYVQVQSSVGEKSPVGMGVIPPTYLPGVFGTAYPNIKFSNDAFPIVSVAEKVSLDRAPFIDVPSSNVTATIMPGGTSVFSKNAFTSKTDRALGFMSATSTGADSGSFGLPFKYSSLRGGTPYEIGSNSRVSSSGSDDNKFYPYSLITQSYSTYIGLEVENTIPSGWEGNLNSDSSGIELPKFYFNPSIVTNPEDFRIPSNSPLYSCSIDGKGFVNTGHLANVYRSSVGRWGKETIKTIYRNDSDDPFYAITSRVAISTANSKLYQGDCFITSIFKRITFKNGVEEAKSATPADAATYGIGIITTHNGDDYTAEKAQPEEKTDDGRNLYDVGQIIEIATQTNINADIRSLETVSDDENALYGGERNFYPNKKEMFGDGRPDSSAYNHGYTGTERIVIYNRIQENSPTYNTSFPNRILLSERNKTQSFFNSFRDIKGFNFRDYGVELGPIIKIVGIKNILLSIHPSGVLAIGIDDKTLLADGGDVYVDTAEALSPTSKTISDVYGSTNPESIVKTDITVAGVDYSASAIWLFEGNKLSVISEFAIKTILEKFKSQITGIPRVYSTFDFNKHTLIVNYVSEDEITKNQTNIGAVVYNTALQKWSSRLDEGNKFSMTMGTRTFTTGFTQYNGKVNSIWEEGALTVDGKEIRNKFRGINRNYEFEFTINMQPSVEKILDNLLAITNKVLPEELVYTISNDNSDAANATWKKANETLAEELEVHQAIVTRKNSSRSGRLGILEENAYYKNSDLYISVDKRGTIGGRASGVKRIRGKNIKVRFVYTGNDKTFLQAIISMLSISYS